MQPPKKPHTWPWILHGTGRHMLSIPVRRLVVFSGQTLRRPLNTEDGLWPDKEKRLKRLKRFDLTFKGDILPEHAPDQVRDGFAELFRIRDPLVLAELFSGAAFVLRSDLDLRSATDYFHRITDIGGVAQLVPTTTPAANSDSGLQEVFTRVIVEDPATFQAPRRGETVSVPPEPLPKSPPISPQKKPESDTPSRQEVLVRLRSLKSEAEAGLATKLDQLKQMQDEVNAECGTEPDRIKAEREEILLASEDDFTRLQQLETQSHQLLRESVARIFYCIVIVINYDQANATIQLARRNAIQEFKNKDTKNTALCYA